jgi:quinolinate synthase
MMDVSVEIRRLAAERGALILAHYYQTPDVIAVAGCVGDSFEMARRAAEAAEPVLIVCGVRFMAESAKLLSPQKTVYLPAPDAGCPMADMITPADVRALRAKHPRAAFLCYVNTSAEVKAACDICCTSSSAVRIARTLPEKEIVFLPDQNLGAYVAAQVPEKMFYFFEGFCPIHHDVTLADVDAARAARPDAVLLVHPECRPEVVAQANYVGSTSGILDYVRKSSHEEFIIGTERGVMELLETENTGKRLYMLSPVLHCPNMKKTRLHDIRACLLGQGGAEITLNPATAQKARQALERMVAM